MKENWINNIKTEWTTAANYCEKTKMPADQPPAKLFCSCCGPVWKWWAQRQTDPLKPPVSNTPHWFKDWKEFRAAVDDMLVHLIQGDKKAVFNLILLPPSWLLFSFSLTHSHPTKFFPQT